MLPLPTPLREIKKAKVSPPPLSSNKSEIFQAPIFRSHIRFNQKKGRKSKNQRSSVISKCMHKTYRIKVRAKS
jgi:hypothetical protein